jgi:hypothetical protein
LGTATARLDACVADLDERASDGDLWNDPTAAKAVMAELADAKEQLAVANAFEARGGVGGAKGKGTHAVYGAPIERGEEERGGSIFNTRASTHVHPLHHSTGTV